MNNSFSRIQRSVLLDNLSIQYLDVLVIGGGIVGTGIALDAQTSG